MFRPGCRPDPRPTDQEFTTADTNPRITPHMLKHLPPPARLGPAIFLTLISVLTARSGSGSATAAPEGQSAVPSSVPMNINRMTMWANGDGVLGYNAAAGGLGVRYRGDAAALVAREGLIWGGIVRDGRDDQLLLGGQSYVSGTSPGAIVRPGVAENPSNDDVRIYRVRRDWATGDLTHDAAVTFGIPEVLVTPADIARLRELYRADWRDWPWEKGAPYYDRDGVPGYQPDPDGGADSLTDEPGLAEADQVLWFVANDLDSTVTESLYNGRSAGLEMQVTCWAYDRADGIGDVVYQRYRLIYKGTAFTPAAAYIQSMYLAKWVDADIGNYTDDYAGYDAAGDLMYAYNADPTDLEFDKVPAVPAVVGYALLQGPRVPASGREAYWNIGSVDGYRNLRASSFTYFDGSVRNSDANLSNFRGAGEMWNILRGYEGTPFTRQDCYIDPITNECTKFELTGDPENFSGWVDGIVLGKSDRRILLSSGNFTITRGDTQEVVFALVGGRGADNRGGITDMKNHFGAAKDLFLTNFDPPAAIPHPTVRPVELDRKIILDWESDQAALAAVESYESRGFRFEDYEIYQMPALDSPEKDWVALPAFDILKPRFISVTADRIRGRDLVNGQKYYFALRTRMYNPNGSFVNQRIRSTPVRLTVTPHAPNPGVVYPYAPGDQISDAYNLVGNNEAKVTVRIYDPSRPDGHIYKMLFHRSPNQLVDLYLRPWWDLIDSTSGDTLIKGVSTDSAAIRVIGRGFTVEALSPLYGLRGVYQREYNGLPDSALVFNQPNPAVEYMVVGAGSSYLDTILGGNALDVDVELRFHGDSSWALMIGPTAPSSRWVRVPYTAWQIGKIGPDSINRQIYTVISGQGSDSLWRPTILLDREYDGETIETFYPVTIVSDSQKLGTGSIAGTYNDNVQADSTENVRTRGFLWVNGGTYSIKNAVWKVYIADLDHDGEAAPIGTTIRFERFKFIRNGDEKIFIPSAVATSDYAAAKLAVEEVNVFPNPYYGFNAAEVDRFSHFVTFSHLPRTAVIRIVNLAGDVVRTIAKDDDSQFATWDLNNHNGLPVGGGLYLALIEMKDGAGRDLGNRTLKLMVVPEKQSIQLR